jgi:hypothetical protein
VEEEGGRYGCSSQINARARSASSCIFQDEGQCQHNITCIAVPLLLLFHWRSFTGNLLFFTWTEFNTSFEKISPNAHYISLATFAPQTEHAPVECSQPALGPQTLQAHANVPPVPSLPRPTRSRVVPSSRLVCTYIYKATECELAPLMSQISNVHPATLS